MSSRATEAGRAASLVLMGTLLVASPLRSQEAAGSNTDADGASAAQADSLELVFEREVFNYPLFDRRNPFRPLSADEASGPRFEDMVYLGAILSSDPGESIALIGARVPGATSEQPTARTYRLRLNDAIGNVRVLDIRTDAVLVEVQDFGVTETRTLSRRAEPPPAPAEPESVAPAEEEPSGAPPEETPQDSVADSGGQAGLDDVNGSRFEGAPPTTNEANGNGGWS